MIVFDLRCGGGHVFEAWFASGAAYEAQRAAGQISCPVCDDAAIEKAVMAPAVPAKGNAGPPAHAVRAMMAELATVQAKMLQKSAWVGNAFSARARAMHAGEESAAAIHGQATLAEARALVDEGVPIAPLPLPVVPPEAKN